MPPFIKPVEINFDERVNVFVGGYASGKSRVLSSIDEYFNPRLSDNLWPMTREKIDLRFLLSENVDFTNYWAKDRNLLAANREFNNAHCGRHAHAAQPVLVGEANFIPERLLSLRTRNSAAYKGLYALQMKSGASDWRTGEQLAFATWHQENIDIHHIFPVA